MSDSKATVFANLMLTSQAIDVFNKLLDSPNEDEKLEKACTMDFYNLIYSLYEEVSITYCYVNYPMDCIKAIVLYMIRGTKTITDNDIINSGYITIDICSLYLNKNEGLSEIDERINALKEPNIKKNLISLVSNKLQAQLNAVDTKTNYSRFEFILHYMKKYVSLGSNDALRYYALVNNPLNLTIDDIASYFKNDGYVYILPEYLSNKLGILHSPRIFEICVSNVLNSQVITRDNTNKNEYKRMINNYMNASINRLLFHTTEELTLESKLVLNRYAYAFTGLNPCFTGTDGNFHNMIRCKNCFRSNYYLLECNNYYYHFQDVLKECLSQYTLIDKNTLLIISEFICG